MLCSCFLCLSQWCLLDGSDPPVPHRIPRLKKRPQHGTCSCKRAIKNITRPFSLSGVRHLNRTAHLVPSRPHQLTFCVPPQQCIENLSVLCHILVGINVLLVFMVKLFCFVFATSFNSFSSQGSQGGVTYGRRPW